MGVLLKPEKKYKKEKHSFTETFIRFKENFERKEQFPYK